MMGGCESRASALSSSPNDAMLSAGSDERAYIGREYGRRTRQLEAARAAFARQQSHRSTASLDDRGSSPLMRLPTDCIARVLCFLSFVERSTCIRPVCSRLEELCGADALWVLICYDREITGAVVADDDDSVEQVEPSLYLPCLTGANAMPYETLLPVQVAGACWAASTDCRHVSPAMAEACIAKHIAPAHRAVATRKVSDSPYAKCVGCGCAKPQFICIHCGLVACSRAHGGCMAKHVAASGNRPPVNREGSREVDTPHCGPTVDLNIPCQAGHCYSCADNLAGLSQSAADGGRNELHLPERLQKLFAQRDLHRSATHAGLFLRHECPHLTDHRIKYVARLWSNSRHRQLLIDSNCTRGLGTVPRKPHRNDGQHATWPRGGGGGCINRGTYLCLHCGSLLCGIGAASKADGSTGHMHQHVLETGHMCVLGLRSLTPYCFGCDRVIGVGGTAADAQRAAKLRRVFTRSRAIYHHMPHATPWRFVENESAQNDWDYILDR